MSTAQYDQPEPEDNTSDGPSLDEPTPPAPAPTPLASEPTAPVPPRHVPTPPPPPDASPIYRAPQPAQPAEQPHIDPADPLGQAPVPVPQPDASTPPEEPQVTTAALAKFEKPAAEPHRAKAAEKGWHFVDLDDPNVAISVDASRLLKASLARQYAAIPIAIDEAKKVVLVATEDPDDVSRLNTLRQHMTGYTVRFGYANPRAIVRHIESMYSAANEAKTISEAEEAARRANLGKDSDNRDLGRLSGDDDSAASQILNLTIEQALRQGASDIHIEPEDGALIVRIRVDGKLREIAAYPLSQARNLMTKIKVDARMKSDNFFVPDSGVLQHRMSTGQKVDIRVEVSPVAWGPGAVMRLQQNVWRELSGLGFSEHNETRIRRALGQSNGLILATGPTGSGKHLALSTPIPTPTGTTTMGDLNEGDEVIGRDGKPCRVVTLWPVNESPDLYRVTMSDGQVIYADADHQWLVSTHHTRNVPRTKKRITAIDRHLNAHADAQALYALADNWDGPESMTSTEIAALLDEQRLAAEFRRGSRTTASEYAVRMALQSTDCPFETVQRPFRMNGHVVRDRTAKVYPTEQILAAVASSRSGLAAQCQQILDSGDFPAETKTTDFGKMLGVGAWLAVSTIKRHDIAGRDVTYTESYGLDHDHHAAVIEYPTAVALKSLAIRLEQRFHTPPSVAADLSRMTTGEMIAAGLRLGQGHANFAVPVTASLDLREADVPVDPYVLGAWLGDGSVGGAGMTGIDDEMWAHFEAAGYEMTHNAHDLKAHYAKGLRSHLRTAGVIDGKHIPVNYLRASADQRLALLQGLMDTDGSVDANGCCELSLSDRRLATGALDLIRSLGIKASISWDQAASYRDDEGNRVECKNRHRIHFTTTQQVFRLPRKARRIKSESRETQGWLYVTNIEPVLPGDADYEPARCITVDSPDRTYLCGDGYVVTSNTTTLYSALREKISPEEKIITLENPIEYQVPHGVYQHSINVAQKMTFAEGLRSILREDPDIVLVGEVRDRETAETAIDASMTGHLVLSTLHTNDAPGVVPRLLRMGIEPFLLSSSLKCVIGQRLMRRLCPNCRVPRPIDRTEIEEMRLSLEGMPSHIFEVNPDGCEQCHGGIAGRTPIHEVMLIGQDLILAIADNVPQEDIIRLAREAGMTSMREDGWEKVKAGVSSLTELNKSANQDLV